MSRSRAAPWSGGREPWVVAALGVLLFLASLGVTVVFDGLAALASGSALAWISLSGGVAAAVAGGGIWLARSDVQPPRYGRILRWCLGVAAGFLSLNLVMMAAFPADALQDNAGWAVFAAGSGALGGFLVGVAEARAIDRAVAAERSAVENEAAERRRQWLDYLNSLLRHEVLNNANVVQGYADLLLEEHAGESSTTDRLETIRRQSQDMTNVIRDVRVLIQATNGDGDSFRPVDLGAVLDDELEELRLTYDCVEVDLDCPDGVRVLADDLLPRAFANLLSNAVEHNDSGTPRVAVRVERTDGTAAVHVADNGPGVAERERETLFQRSDADHGLGLYLVRVLAARYGGSVRLSETGPDGSVFTVELPTASAALEGDAPTSVADPSTPPPVEAPPRTPDPDGATEPTSDGSPVDEPPDAASPGESSAEGPGSATD